MSVDLARPLRLRPDARLVPASRLPADVRAAVGARRGEHALVAGSARAASLVVDGATARLLRRLASPGRVADALLAEARARRADPGRVLDAAFPLLERLAREGWLVAADARAAAGLAVGDRVGAWTVTDRLRAVDETAVCQVRDRRGRVGALKHVRERAGSWLDGAVAREARVLRRLAGRGAPTLLARGTHDGAPYLVCSWLEGVPLSRAAAERRAAGDARGLLALAVATADAYAGLHAAGVLHGDVHPTNALADRLGRVALLDFGHAVLAGDRAPAPPRVGVPEFHEPELAAALRATGRAVPATPLGEQHAVGALLYELFTGQRWCDFSLVRDELLRQLAESPPRAFADAGAPPWPAVERALRRALAKRPRDRFPSVAALARALAACAPPRRARAGADAAPERRRAFVDAVLAHAGPDGRWSTAWPRGAQPASARDGAAGVAYALHRAAAARGDARLLALADVWAERAAAMARRRPGVFFARTGALARARLGDASFLHAGPGVHVVRALVARARGDDAGLAAGARAFAAGPLDTPHATDLAFGAPGLLLAAALLRDAGTSSDPRGADALARVDEAGDRLAVVVRDAVRAGGGRRAPGAAHGLAGALYALLAWHREPATARALRPALRDLERLAVPAGRGLSWPWQARAYGPGERPAFVGGWCNGSAGYAHLFLAAHRRLGDPAWLDLAERAGWHAWESPAAGPSLCCGDAGRAYALLALHRATGEPAWLDRARGLADRAARAAGDPAAAPPSLYRGALGVAVLLADLERPGEGRMPLFEVEGWRE